MRNNRRTRKRTRRRSQRGGSWWNPMTWGNKKKKSKPWGEATWQAQTRTGATPPPKETPAMVREGETRISPSIRE